MTQAMRRATRELCTGICRGRGPQAFAPTGLVTGLVQCRYCCPFSILLHSQTAPGKTHRTPTELSPTTDQGKGHDGWGVSPIRWMIAWSSSTSETLPEQHQKGGASPLALLWHASGHSPHCKTRSQKKRVRPKGVPKWVQYSPGALSLAHPPQAHCLIIAAGSKAAAIRRPGH